MLTKYFLAWFGMMLLAILNGVLRDLLYKPQLGELAAHQISTLLLLLLLAAYFWLLTSRWRLKTSRQAWLIGLVWLVMTLAFEVGLGRLSAGSSWAAILADYNILAGRIWILIPFWTLVGPYVFFRLRSTP